MYNLYIMCNMPVLPCCLSFDELADGVFQSYSNVSMYEVEKWIDWLIDSLIQLSKYVLGKTVLRTMYTKLNKMKTLPS
jgi:hypothetical protein